MNKGEFIVKALSKISHKKYEQYAISRLWHKLDSLDVEFLFQQYISLKGYYVLADLYLPQLNIIIEIDESHHFDIGNGEVLKLRSKDEVRDNDVIEAIQAEVIRIPAVFDNGFNIETFNKEIDEVVERIKVCKDRNESFVPWDYEKRLTSDYYIEKGSITLNDKCAFRTMVEAANCFGKQYAKKGIWNGGIQHSMEKGKSIWFPKLYKNKDWDNSIDFEEIIIVEKAIDFDQRIKHFDKIINLPNHTRIVFARGVNSFGEILYRFKGEFALDREKSSIDNGLIWYRIKNEAITYKRQLI